jgi:hypothetical protein
MIEAPTGYNIFSLPEICTTTLKLTPKAKHGMRRYAQMGIILAWGENRT